MFLQGTPDESLPEGDVSALGESSEAIAEGGTTAAPVATIAPGGAKRRVAVGREIKH